MANTLAALKRLPCPAGDDCTAFQCLFGHSRDALQSGTNTDNSKPITNRHTSEVQPGSHTLPLGVDDKRVKSEQQRKRIKLDLDGTATASQPASLAKVNSQIKANGEKVIMASKLPNTNEKASSPIWRRKLTPPTETYSQIVGGETQPQQPLNTVTTAPPSPLTPKFLSQQKQVKRSPESLNPRLLKKAPTSHPTRVALVKALHKEYQRLNEELRRAGAERQLLLTDQELVVKTLDDEQEIAIKKAAVYSTSIRSKILVYKRMTPAQWKDERSKAMQNDNLNSPNGPNSARPDTTPTPITVETGLTTFQEIQFLPRLVEDLTGLEAHGYITKIPSKDDIEAADAGVKSCGNMEACDRCTRRFQVFPGRRASDGALASNGPCIYHPGKLYFVDRPPGDRSRPLRRFRCCQRSLDDDAGGCTTAQHHVFKTTNPKRLASTLNFVKTPNNPDVPKDRAVSFDCEMGYTVYGLELIRLTVVSWPDGAILLDILVRPVGEVLDLNTRFSGVRPEDMALAERYEAGCNHGPPASPKVNQGQKPERLKIVSSPKAARDLLFTVISANTPVIGHGLENDLNATRIIHPTCIDTVLLWPHSRGLPMRNSLRSLMEIKLGRKIQLQHGTGSSEGHDSAEDARAAGDLVRLKIRDEWKIMRTMGWNMDANGKILPPTGED
ncbi:hypothetical protein GGR50DRAFT_680915 [Xylaria sp. CBS 124048]|nr:hypothetical protein GGR50DRAFT_680915 [Xylaria sp. CBS 124048]